MSKRVINRQINLSANHGIVPAGDTTFSVVNFEFQNVLPNDYLYEHQIAVDNAQIPVSFYNVNSNNNTLTVSLNGGATSDITISEANYSTTTLATELVSKLTAAGFPSPTVTLNQSTGKFAFAISAGYFTFHGSTSTCYGVPGFIGTNDYTSVTQTLNSATPVNLLGPLKLRISTSLNVHSITSGGGSKSLLVEIPVSSPNFGLILYNNIGHIWSELNQDSIDSFSILIQDDNGTPIDFNNQSWSISLLVRSIPILDSEGNPVKRSELHMDSEIELEPDQEEEKEEEEPVKTKA